MFGSDLALLGVILAAVAIPVAIAVPVVLYIREGHAKIQVSGEFDKTGFVEVVIAKRGRRDANRFSRTHARGHEHEVATECAVENWPYRVRWRQG